MISYEGIYRHENFTVPKEALREAIINSIVHKDYSSNIPIQISVYNDCLMIWNSGHLYEGWTIENLFQKHSSAPFNPEIANTFFRAGLIEAWGRGIEKMTLACLKNNIPAPQISIEQGGFWIKFDYNTSVKTPVKTPDATIDILREHPAYTLAEVAEILEKSTSAVERAARKLREHGRLRHIGPQKGGHWEIIEE